MLGIITKILEHKLSILDTAVIAIIYVGYTNLSIYLKKYIENREDLKKSEKERVRRDIVEISKATHTEAAHLLQVSFREGASTKYKENQRNYRDIMHNIDPHFAELITKLASVPDMYLIAQNNMEKEKEYLGMAVGHSKLYDDYVRWWNEANDVAEEVIHYSNEYIKSPLDQPAPYKKTEY